MSIGIIGIGSAVPNKVLTNDDLSKLVDTSDEWIRVRTGIKERRIATKQESIVDIAAEAAKLAIRQANIKPEDINLIILCTATPEYVFPSTASLVQKKIAAVNSACFDISVACSGFLYGLHIGCALLSANPDMYKNILIIGAEFFSRVVDWKDRSTCVLFGDGAGAVVISHVEENFGVLGTDLGTDSNLWDLLTLPNFTASEEIKNSNNGTYYIRMKGKELFRVAINCMTNSVLKCLQNCNLRKEDINLLIPHQANIRIIEAIAEKLQLPKEKVYTNLDRYGNVSAASIPIALDEAIKEGKIKKNDIVVLTSFGGGLTWATVIIKWQM